MDWNYINTLLSVIHQAAAAGPKFASVAAQATDELVAYMHQPIPEEPTETEEPETVEEPSTVRRI